MSAFALTAPCLSLTANAAKQAAAPNRVVTMQPKLLQYGIVQHRQQQLRNAIRAQSADTTYGNIETDAPPESYVVVGLSHCFVKNDEGRLSDAFMLEPIAAHALEALAKGQATSFVHVWGTTFGEIVSQQKDVLPDALKPGQFCEDFAQRLNCVARTWTRPHAQDNLMDIVPLNKVRSNFNTNTQYKRVLNVEVEVSDSDNIKQDLSIDVYGRKAAAEAAEAFTTVKTVAAPVSVPGSADDDLDSLLFT